MRRAGGQEEEREERRENRNRGETTTSRPSSKSYLVQLGRNEFRPRHKAVIYVRSIPNSSSESLAKLSRFRVIDIYVESIIPLSCSTIYYLNPHSCARITSGIICLYSHKLSIKVKYARTILLFSEEGKNT